MALIRYGLRCGGACVVFILCCMGVNCPWNPPFPMGSPGNSRGRFDEVPLPGTVYGYVD